ncbi:hypothetical protein [Lysinibacillus telephonicus]|uniref:hypothetical protein n=1 Tax=Lysinibacillus telephonicus TaxID=1714840 RepID=UPI0037CDCCDC
MIKIRGQATLKVDFAVELNISEEEFETFSVKKQNMLIDEAIDWRNTLRNAETDDIEVWEYEEVKGDSGD